MTPPTREMRWWQSEDSPTTAPSPTSPARKAFECAPDVWGRLDANRNIIAAISLIVVLATVIAVSRSKPARLRWQKSHATAQAEKLITRAQMLPESLEVFSLACKESPDRPHLLRALAKSCASENPALARRCYNRIAELHATTSEDDAAHAILLARLQDFIGARAILDNAQRTSPAYPPLLLASLSVARESQDFNAATRVLDELAKISPVSMDETLLTAEAAARVGVPLSIMTRLENHTLNAFALSAATYGIKEMGARAERLTRLPMTEPANRTRALQILQCLENAPVEQRLAVVLFAHTCAGSSREEQRRACIENMHRAGGLTADEKNRVATLLQRRGEHALVTEIITLPESLIEYRLFDRRLLSLLHLGQWKDASTMVADPSAPKPLHNRLFTRALATLKTIPVGNPIASDLLTESLKEATEEASAPACFTIGCIALEQRLRPLAEDAFAAAASLATENETIIENIINTARRSGMSVPDVLRILTQNAPTQAPSPFILAKLCYLRLLVRDNLNDIKTYLVTELERSPDNAYLHFLSALELHHRGDFAGVLKLLVPMPKHRWHQGEAAVLASMIASAGQTERSSVLIQKLDLTRLFPEERAMVEPWRNRLSIALPALGEVPTLHASVR